MLLHVGSHVRYKPEKVRAMVPDPTLRQHLMGWRGTVTGWIGRERVVVDFGEHGTAQTFLDHLEPG